MQNLRAKIVWGTFWAILEKIIPQIIVMGVTPFLARILTPKDFGLFAMASIVMGFLNLFSDYGFGFGIVKKKDITEADKSTAFSFSCIVSIVLFSIVYLISKPVSKFFSEPQLINILKTVAFVFLISPFSGIQYVLLQKQMRFKNMATANIAGSIGYGITSLSMACYGFGIRSLICGMITEHLARLTVVYYYSRWRYKIEFNIDSFKYLFNYGIYLFLFRIIDYISMQLDKMIIGKRMDTRMLGYYSVADALSKKLFYFIGIPVGNVLFPAFSLIQEDSKYLHRAVLRVYEWGAMVIFPISIGIIFVAKEIVYIYLGPSWHESVLLIQLLAPAGGIMVLGSFVGSIFFSQGKTDIHFKLGCFNSVVRITAVLIGARWGAVGIALSLCATQCGILFWNPYIMCRLIKLDSTLVFSTYIKPFVYSLIMAVGIYGIRMSFHPTIRLLSHFLHLIIIATGGLIIYTLLYRISGIKLEEKVFSIISQLKK